MLNCKNKIAARSKRDRKPLSRLIDEISETKKGEVPQKKAQKSKDNIYYDADIVKFDLEGKKVLIHFTGYSKEHDEWKAIDNSADFPLAKV